MASVDSRPVERSLLRQDVRERVKAQAVRAATERGILLVRTNDLPSEGLLSERQQEWVNSAPYDGWTQNPVVYRHDMDRSKAPKVRTELDEARQEVKSLPEVVPRPSSVGTGSVDTRLREGRKERHDVTVQDMKDELALLSSEFEVRINAEIDTLKSNVTENDQVIAGLFHQASTPEDLHTKTLPDLEALWHHLSNQTTLRQGFIQSLDTRLCDLERERCASVTEILRDYAHQLSLIAYLLPSDMDRLIEEEAYVINTAVIDNRKVYSQLCMHLQTGELGKQRENHDRWESIISDWKELVCQSSLVQFQTFLESEAVHNPPNLQMCRERLIAEQQGIQRRREGLLGQVSALAPPKATRAAVYELKASADKLHQQLENVHTSFLLGYQSCLESLSRECEEEMEKCRDDLVSSGAVDGSSVHKMLNNVFVPSLEKVAAKMRDELHSIERGLDATLNSQRTQFDSLFSYCQGAALLWDQHTDTLAVTQREFQEKLEGCRSAHDRENQNLEANLDLLLDRLRQGPTQEALQEYLQEALRMLDTIKQGYERFQTLILDEIRGYPELIQKELDCYDTALCQYLGVSRSPIKKSKSKLNMSRAASEMSRMESRASRVESRAKTRKSKPLRSKTTVTGMGKQGLPPISSGSSLVEDVMITVSGGVQFYVLNPSKSNNKGDNTFLTQDEESEGSAVSFATENIAVSQEVFTKTQDKMVVGFLEQLEQWRSSKSDSIQTTLSGKEEECHTELDLRLHLHEPRASRVEKDIHNVRLAELIAHRDRITRHSTSLTTSLTLQRGAGERLAELLTDCGEKFIGQVESLVSELEACSKTADLLKIQSKAEQTLEQHIGEVMDLSSQQTRLSLSVLDDLAESNTSYRTSIKLFSEGGNYCPEEVNLFVKKLNKLSSKVTSTRSHVSSEMKSATEQQLTASHDRLDQFDSVFKLHFTDLSFLEAISRTLTSAQVRIKSEVAGSNNQCTTIAGVIADIKSLVEGSKKKSASSSEFLSRLPALFTMLTDRVEYLYCSAKLQGSRVGGHSGVIVSTSGLRPIGSMNVTRSIIEHVTRQLSTASPSDRKLSTVTPAQSGARVGEHHLSVSLHADGKHSGKQSRKKMAMMERKHINFGVGGGEDESKSFLPRVRAILKSAHAELFDLTEAYYKNKGSRPPTRPSEIAESFEGHMDSLIAKSQSYRSQAEEYRNNCIQEFRDQLVSLMVILEKVPALVFSDLLQKWRGSGGKERVREHTELKERSSQQKILHQKSLRPTLGHPSQSDTLNTLCSKEEQRHSEMMDGIRAHAEQMREGEKTSMRGFVSELAEMTRKLLSLLDTMTNDSEIIPIGDQSKDKQPMEVLLRRHMDGTLTPEASHSSQPPHTPGKRVWPTLPKSDLLGETKSSELVSKKSTSAHEAVIRERDAVFQEYRTETNTFLESVRLNEEKERSLEEKWFENWTQSVDKVRQLYS